MRNDTIKKFSLRFVAVLFAALLSGCAGAEKFPIPCLSLIDTSYGEFYYYPDGDGAQIHYISMENPTEPRNICFDPLCTHDNDDCPFYIRAGGYYSITVDKNADHPVLYFSSTSFDVTNHWERKSEIVRYDMKKGKKRVLLSDIEFHINGITLFGDWIYYVVGDDSTGRNDIYRIPSNGGKPELLTGDADEGLYISSVDGETMYLFDDFGNVYAADRDFSGIQMLKTGLGREYLFCYVHDGYLYFTRKDDSVTVETEEPYWNFDTHQYDTRLSLPCYTMVRIPVSLEYREPEEVCRESIYSILTKRTDEGIYFVRTGYEVLGSRPFYDIDTEQEVSRRYAVTDGTIVFVNTDTLEETVVLSGMPYNVNRVCEVTEGYLLFEGQNIQKAYETGEEQASVYVVYDRIARTYTEISDW